MYHKQPVNAWLTVYRGSAPATSRIALFPYAGGGAHALLQWALPLLDQFELVVVHLPGREGRCQEECSRDWRQICVPLAEALGEIDDLPFALFGHSMGALLAYETCRALARSGAAAPYLLIVSGRSAAHLALRPQHYHQLPQGEFFKAVSRLGGMSPEIMAQPALLDYIEPILRADLELHDLYQYQPGPVLDLPLVALGADDDTFFPLLEVARWRDSSSCPFKLHRFTGGHFFINAHRDAVLAIVAHHCHSQLPAQTIEMG